MYADSITDSMRMAMNETERRRALQAAYNAEHGITPTTIVKDIDGVLGSVYERDYGGGGPAAATESPAEVAERIAALERDMRAAAANLDFEAAAHLRDRITRLKDAQLGLGDDTAAPS
jgi:excinuclease ABC subunit B